MKYVAMKCQLSQLVSCTKRSISIAAAARSRKTRKAQFFLGLDIYLSLRSTFVDLRLLHSTGRRQDFVLFSWSVELGCNSI